MRFFVRNAAIATALLALFLLAPVILHHCHAWAADLIQVQQKTPANANRNSKTDNLNILFIGADGERLLMTSVYTIDYKNKKNGFKSAGIFFQDDLALKHKKKDLTLREFYSSYTPGQLKEALGNLLGVKIAYYVHMDKAILKEAEKMLDPIIVDGERISLPDLFEIPAGSKDQKIFEQLMRQFTRPKTYFYHLPTLIIRSARHIQTDFPLTAENLYLHFRIARDVDMGNITKIILEDPSEALLKDIIYRTTKDTTNE
ncbi:MAG: hypothetical protein AB1420_17725 [Bacillota bacterium]